MERRWQNDRIQLYAPLIQRTRAFTPWDIHEWIYASLKIPDYDVQIIQIEGERRQVFIKLFDQEKVMTILHETAGQVEYKYSTGEVFQVTMALAGMGTKRVGIANLPPEVPSEVLRDALTPYGRVLDVHNESWSKDYRYAVSNGIRQATVLMTKHAPSQLNVAGYKTLLSYDDQPATCYGYENTGHMFQNCPSRQELNRARMQTRPASYAAVLAVAAPTEETPIQTSPTIDDTKVQPGHNKESRKLQCEPASRAGVDDEENGALQHVPHSSRQKAGKEPGSHLNADTTDTIALDAQNNTETEDSQVASVNIQDEGSGNRGEYHEGGRVSPQQRTCAFARPTKSWKRDTPWIINRRVTKTEHKKTWELAQNGARR